MKAKILISIVLILSFILTGAIGSYAAEASVSACVLIIIPPREDKIEEKTAEADVHKEESSSEDTTVYAKDNRED